MFTQNIIELSSAVYELSYEQKKNSQNVINVIRFM